MSTIIRKAPLPAQTRNGRGTQWTELIEELRYTDLNGDAGLIAEGVSGTAQRTMTSSLRKVFKTHNLPYRASTRKVGDDTFDVWVVRRNDN